VMSATLPFNAPLSASPIGRSILAHANTVRHLPTPRRHGAGAQR
jgi:hypothetical protein